MITKPYGTGLYFLSFLGSAGLLSDARDLQIGESAPGESAKREIFTSLARAACKADGTA